MSPTFKVALIQMRPKPLDPPGNFAEASRYITEAAKQGASLAVLPEYHLTGWSPHEEDFFEYAGQALSYVSKYQSLAKELKINIVTGTILTATSSGSTDDDSAAVQDAGKHTPPDLHNISNFITHTGEIAGSYTKKNLWHPERPHLTSTGKDEEHTVIETPLGTVGILVCWDLAFPEAFRALIRKGAKIIIIPTYWKRTDCSPEGLAINPEAEDLFLTSILTSRAFENTCCVIFVNAGGPASEDYCGLSRVTLPIVGPVAGSFDDSEEGMRVVEVDMEILEVAERNYKIREDLGRDDWHYGYSHVDGDKA